MEKQKGLDFVTIFAPLMSALILNAFYSALILKKLSNIEITQEIRDQVFLEVFDKWLALQAELDEKIPRKRERVF